MNDNKRQDPKPKQVSHEGGTSGLIEVQVLPLSKLVGNTGQIEGLPKNPRIIRDEKFAKLKKSIEDDPEMLELRELLVYPNGDRYVVIGGNMRLRVLLDLKATEAPCKVLPKSTPVAKLRAYATKDNVPFGEFDWDALANEWDAAELSDWGLDLPIGHDKAAEPIETAEVRPYTYMHALVSFTAEQAEEAQSHIEALEQMGARVLRGAN